MGPRGTARRVEAMADASFGSSARGAIAPAGRSSGGSRPVARALVPRDVRLLPGLRCEARRIESLMGEHQIEVLHAMDGGPQPSVVGARRAVCRVVAGDHAPPPSGHGPGASWVYSCFSLAHADVCLTVSEYNKACRCPRRRTLPASPRRSSACSMIPPSGPRWAWPAGLG